MERLLERHCGCSQMLLVIEYAWAHNMLDVFKDVEVSHWSDADWGSLSLDESWRVRVASAQVFVIVRKRQISHYERVLAFLENIYRLLPTLVPAIKHMKIMFGLKTMVIMWMLKEGTGPVDVVQKINEYFPRKLPQYQEHCRKQEMFLMKKNQVDFRTFAQSLIMDKQKLKDYIQNHVEEQYGDHYAQKTEERLLNYLQELDKALPKGTYIDKIMSKNTPVKEEEKALLDLVSDASKIAVTLKTLHRYDQTALETSADSVRHGEAAVNKIIMNDVHGVRHEQAVAVHQDRNDDTAGVSADKTDTTALEENCLKSGAHVVRISPHFCSKHQRWVRNILWECPGESAEEQPPKDNDLSPLLFTSSSSSSDLTPSNLIIPPGQHQSPPSDQRQKAKDPEFVDKPVSAPVDLEPLSHPAQTAVQSVIPGGGVQVLIIPCKAVTTVSICPLKVSPTSNNPSICSNQDSTTSTLSIAAKTIHQNVSSTPPFVSELCRNFRMGQNESQSQTNIKEHVHSSPQTVSGMIDATNLSLNATAGMETSTNSNTCINIQPSPTEPMAGSLESSAFNSSKMQPRVVLKRMSTEACLKATKGRLQPRQCDNIEWSDEPTDSSFDVNSLYSNSSSSEEDDSDTEYRPTAKTLRRWCFGY